jgi:hypothetical protein
MEIVLIHHCLPYLGYTVNMKTILFTAIFSLIVLTTCDDGTNNTISNYNNTNNINNTNDINLNNYTPEACPGYDYTQCLGLDATACGVNECCSYGHIFSPIVILDEFKDSWRGTEKVIDRDRNGFIFETHRCLPFDKRLGFEMYHYYLEIIHENKYILWHAWHLPTESFESSGVTYCGPYFHIMML